MNEKHSFSVSQKPETIKSGILKGYHPFSGFQRQSLWQVQGRALRYEALSKG